MQNQEQTTTYYLNGLKQGFTNIVCLESYWTFNGLRKLKLKMEKQ